MSLILELNNEQTLWQITEEREKQLQQLLEFAAKEERLDDAVITVSLVDNPAIHELNRTYRGIDRATDVLSFAMREHNGDELEIIYDEADKDALDNSEQLGDIIISVERAMEQSEEYGHSLEREIGFLLVHGFLHLLGYDHHSPQDEQAMFGKQERILQKAGLVR